MTAVLIVVALLAGVLPDSQSAQRAAPEGLRIVVISGEDQVNVIQQKTAVAPVVEVRDRNNLPVAGVTVTFSVAQGATFGGASTITVVTNAAGQAVAAGLTPTAAGAISIQATAVSEGLKAVATIAQSDVLTAAQVAGTAGTAAGAGGTTGAAGGGGVSGTTLGVAGGVVAAGAGASVLLSGDDPPPVAAAPPEPVQVSRSPEGSGIVDVTAFAFTSTNATGRVTWDFGDGTTGEGAQVTHIYNHVHQRVVLPGWMVADRPDRISVRDCLVLARLQRPVETRDGPEQDRCLRRTRRRHVSLRVPGPS